MGILCGKAFQCMVVRGKNVRTAGDNSQIWRQSQNRVTFQLTHVYFECTLEFLSPYRGTGSRIFRPVLCAFHVHVEKVCLKNHPMVCCS